MRLEQALISLLGVNQQETNIPNTNSLRNNFDFVLNAATDRNLSNSRTNRDTRNVIKHNNNNNTININDRGLNQNHNTVNNNTSQERKPKINSESKPNIQQSDIDRDLITDKKDYKTIENDVLKDEPDEVYNSILYTNIVHYISEVINIPETKIETTLNELGITPYDLKDNKNLNRFLQVVYNVENPIELLEIPDIAQVITELNVNIEELGSYENYKANYLDESVEVYDKVTDSSVIEDNTTNKLDMSQDNYSGNKEDNSNEAQSNIYKDEDTLNIAKLQGSTQNMLGDVPVEGEIIFNNINTSISSKGNPLKSQPIQSLIAKDIINQIEGKIKVDIKGEVSEIKMLLKPDNLGEVTLKLLTENGIVTAKFLADNQKVKEIIEANLNDLKDSLSQQGINVSELSVSVGQYDSQSQMQNFLKEQAKSKLRINKIIKDIMVESEEEEGTNNILDSYDSSINYTA